VIAALGDGSYIFGVPTACHQVARQQNLPVLAVVFDNSGWDAVKSAALRVHPDGWVAATKSAPLSSLAPSPRYEEIVRAFDGHGERVEAPDALPGALRRALTAVREEGRQALVNIVCRR
jgi:acetolactate synthase-1/2/3 large subunit